MIGQPEFPPLVAQDDVLQKQQARIEVLLQPDIRPQDMNYEISFDIEKDAPSVATVTLDNVVLQDKNGPCCTVLPTSGTITITDAAGPGDVDGDGKITPADAQWALRLLVGEATGSPGVFASADVAPASGDGQLTLADVRELLRRALSL